MTKFKYKTKNSFMNEAPVSLVLVTNDKLSWWDKMI